MSIAQSLQFGRIRARSGNRYLISENQQRELGSWEVVDGEMFLGGFAGGFLARGLTHIGYGIYFTTNRLIGIDLGKNGGGALGGTLAGFIHGELMPQLSPEESTKTITDLDRMKDFEMEKDRIIRIDLKKPGLFGTGHIVITPKGGKSEKIILRHRIAYDRLVTLTRAFSPETVNSY